MNKYNHRSMIRHKRRSFFCIWVMTTTGNFEIVTILAEWLLGAPHVDGLDLEVINWLPPESLGQLPPLEDGPSRRLKRRHWRRGRGSGAGRCDGCDLQSLPKQDTRVQGYKCIKARTVKRGQRIKPGRTFFQLILPLNQPLKTNYLVSFSVLS